MKPYQTQNFQHRQNLIKSFSRTVEWALENNETVEQMVAQVTAFWNVSLPVPLVYRQMVCLVRSLNPMSLDQVISALSDMYLAAYHIREAKLALARVKMNKSQTHLRVKEMKTFFDTEWAVAPLRPTMITLVPPSSPLLNTDE